MYKEDVSAWVKAGGSKENLDAILVDSRYLYRDKKTKNITHCGRIIDQMQNDNIEILDAEESMDEYKNI